MKEKEAFVYAKMPFYKRLLDKTLAFSGLAINNVENPFVSCSFGKDSAVMLDILLKFKPSIQVVFVEYPETNLIDNYDETIKKWGNINLKRIMVDCEIEDEINEGGILNDFAISNKFDSSFQGLRMAESNGRRISIKKHGKIAKFKNGLTRICPLADWSWKDIATYCVLNKLPTLSVYSKIGFEERTVSGVAGKEYGFREAQLARLRQYDIFRFNNLLRQYPQLAKYA